MTGNKIHRFDLFKAAMGNRDYLEEDCFKVEHIPTFRTSASQ